MSGRPPIHAFLCSTDDPECSRIVFARSNAEARRSYASDDDAGEAEIRRAPQFDQYAPGPVPPLALIDDGWYQECTGCGRRVSLDEAEYERAGPQGLRDDAAANAKVRRDLAAFAAADPEPPPPAPGLTHAERWKAEKAGEEWRARRWRISSAMRSRPLSRPAMVSEGSDVFCDRNCHLDHLDRIADIDLAHEDAEKEAERRWPGAPSYTSQRYPMLNPVVSFHPPGFAHPATWRVKEDETWVHPEDVDRWDVFALGSEKKDGPHQARA